MPVLTFKGGVHPDYDGKAMSKTRPITTYLPSGLIVIPMSQHIGVPATPIVAVGERVLVNQKIGEGSGFISANVHSSVSGVVKFIEPRLITSGEKVLSVVIENDEYYEEYPISNIDVSYPDMDSKDIIALVKEAGVVGMGGAGFPTHVKLSVKNPDDIKYIIVNAAECEPYLTSDYRRMIEEPEKIVEGLKIVLSLFKNAKGIIAIEDNKLDAAVKMKKLIDDEKNIDVKVVYTKYPQGGERALVYAITKNKVNSTMLPSDVGCIVHNVDTIYAIRSAVIERKPLINRIVTVTGDAVVRPQNYLVPIGTSMDELIEASGGFRRRVEKIISGGPMMGIAIYDQTIPVVKTTTSILCISKDEVRANEPSNCINCGRCAKVCPGRVIPSRLAVLAEHGEKEEFVKLNGMECCQCGCCSYICPAKRNLTQSIKTMLNAVKKGKLNE